LGINETKWNHHSVEPGPYVCISPVYGKSERTKQENRVVIPKDCKVRQDSGAFCDGPGQRLSFEKALWRQIEHAEKYGYAEQITERASYDLLIDEKWISGVRHKRRWTVQEADLAIKETIEAAKFLMERGATRRILSVQGVDASQYLDCAKEIIPLLRYGDVLGLGGWCITGKNKRSMLPEFLRTMSIVIPYAGERLVGKMHIWGVLLAEALGPLLWLCDQHKIELATDSSGPSWRPAFGEWGYAEWRKKDYERPPVHIRGLYRKRHVQQVREWLASFRSTKWYQEPSTVPKQLEMLGSDNSLYGG